MGCVTYAVDGVPLDDARGRWRLLKGTTVGLGASVRAVSMTIPGVDGTSSPGVETRDEAALALKLAVRGDSYEEMVANYAGLSMLLAPTSPVEVTRRVGSLEWSQSARGRTIDQPTFSAARKEHTVTATLRLPSVFWRGPVDDWSVSGPSSGASHEVTTLTGSSGPVDDALILIGGPANQPRVTCGSSWFELGLSLTASQSALVDCATWKVRAGSGVTFSGGGSDRSGTLITSGGPYLLRLVPTVQNFDPTDTAVMVALSAGSGMTSGTKLSIRARPSHLA